MVATAEAMQIGEVFKNRRKELNLSLKEAENATSIRMNYLHAIEEGQVSHLISHVYAQGFISQYATFLGLNSEEITAEYMQLIDGSAHQDFQYGIGTIEMRKTPVAGGLPMALRAVAVLGILIGAYYFAKMTGVL